MIKYPTSSPTRRDFLTTGAAAAIGFNFVPRHVLGSQGQVAPSDKLNIGCIGIGGQGGGVTRDLASLPNVNIAALCDVDEKYVPIPAVRSTRITARCSTRRKGWTR